MSDDYPIRMREFAVTRCVPGVLSAAWGTKPPESVCAAIVGSVATGTCTVGSDVDIAVICTAEVFAGLELRSFWESGRPSQLAVDGVPVHYYVIPIGSIERRLRNLNDEYLYTYSTAVIVHDPSSIWSGLEPLLATNPAIRATRVQGKLDMLVRRRHVLERCFADQDPIVVAKVCLEFAVLASKVCALLDDVPFDPRKRLFSAVGSGPTGTRAKDDILAMLESLGRCAVGLGDAQRLYGSAADRVIRLLKEVASSQGLAVSLDRPDPRHCEPQPT